jgi:hypothetical protein
MEFVLKATVNKINGSNTKTEYPDIKDIRFETVKEKDKFRKAKEKEIFNAEPDKCDDLQINLYLTTVIPPDGITDLPADFHLEPVAVSKPVSKPQTISNEPVEHYNFRKPVFKCANV